MKAGGCDIVWDTIPTFICRDWGKSWNISQSG